MKRKIIKVPFANLRKNEFSGLVRGALEIVKKHNPVALFIQVMYSKLEVFDESLNLFIVTEGKKHPFTDVINERYSRARELMYALKLQLKSFQRRNFPEEEETLISISTLLENSLGKTLYTAKHHVKNVLDQLQLLIQNEDFLSASQSMGIEKYLTEIVSLNKEIAILETKNVESRVKKRMTNLSVIKTEIIESYLNLMQAIELAQVEHPELDYAPLVAELNEFLQPRVSEIKRKKTRKSNNQSDKKITATLSDKTSVAAI